MPGTPFGFFLYKKEQAQEIFKMCDTKGPYRNLKRKKKVWRSKADILFETDEDELAAVSCVLQRGALIVLSAIITKPHSFAGYEESQMAFVCVKRDGVWFYPLDAVISILQQEGDKVQVLQTWKQDRQEAREFIEHLVSLSDDKLDKAVLQGDMPLLQPLIKEKEEELP